MKLPSNTRLSIKSVKVHYDDSLAGSNVKYNQTILEIEYSYIAEVVDDHGRHKTVALCGGTFKWPMENGFVTFNSREYSQNEEAWSKLLDLKILSEEIIYRILEETNIEITSKISTNTLDNLQSEKDVEES